MRHFRSVLVAVLVHANDLPRKTVLCPALLASRTVKSSFRASWTWKYTGKLKLKLKDSGWHARDQKKRTKGREKSAPGGKNWYVLNNRYRATFCTSYPKKKKWTCFPIGDVHNQQRERNNLVYVQTKFHRSVYQFEQPHAQSPFLFPIDFGNTLIPFFDGKDGSAVH